MSRPPDPARLVVVERGALMIIRPMLGQWELPCVERVQLVEARRLVRLGVPGLAGDLHQDLGAQSLTVTVTGSLQGAERRSELLAALQEAYRSGQPQPFVADIAESSELEDVVVVGFEVVETGEWVDAVRYRLVLRQYVEPPAPAAGLPELPSDVLADLEDLAGSLLDALDLPGLLADVPDVADPSAAIRPALDTVKSAVADLPGRLDGLRAALGVGS